MARIFTIFIKCVATLERFLRVFTPFHTETEGFEYVYVNQDGSVRELSPQERAYLLEEFSGGDSGRPYIKSNYWSLNGWGSRSGFILRRGVPRRIKILPVNPNYDAAVQQLSHSTLDLHRAVGDIVVDNPDGSTSCTPNPEIPRDKRSRLARQFSLDQQKRREELARNSLAS
jgi:hypothetical protein